MTQKKVVVYRHFDSGGRLLYVGCSRNPLARSAGHLSQASWADDIARIEVQAFDLLTDALAAEARAISTESPLHNIKGRAPPARVTPMKVRRMKQDHPNHPSLLTRIQQHMANIRGVELVALANDLKISYDTLLRIRDGKTDPAFSKVQRLADHFRLGWYDPPMRTVASSNEAR